MTALPRTLVIAAKTLFAFLGFSAVVTEMATLVARGRFAPADFFSYFTVESNVLAVVSLMLSAFALARDRRSGRLDFFRGAVTLYMTTTILVFIVLLSGYPSNELTAVPWDNTVLHYIMPIAIIVDWLAATSLEPISFRKALAWLALPLVYLVYSLIRGPIAHWYPYPFLNPSTHGYVGVALTSVVVAVVIAALTWGVARASGWSLMNRVRIEARS